jgi:serine protease AprX
VTYVVTITPGNGFTGTVTLSVSGLPSRASGSFSPNPATTSSTLTVNTSNGTTVTTYTLIITGVSAGLTHTTMVTLVVT